MAVIRDRVSQRLTFIRENVVCVVYYLIKKYSTDFKNVFNRFLSCERAFNKQRAYLQALHKKRETELHRGELWQEFGGEPLWTIYGVLEKANTVMPKPMFFHIGSLLFMRD